MPDASGEKDTAAYCIAKDFPFRMGTGDPAIPKITAIDTVYLGPDLLNAYIIRNFRVVGGK